MHKAYGQRSSRDVALNKVADSLSKVYSRNTCYSHLNVFQSVIRRPTVRRLQASLLQQTVIFMVVARNLATRPYRTV
jgi:hypothetical protein